VHEAAGVAAAVGVAEAVAVAGVAAVAAEAEVVGSGVSWQISMLPKLPQRRGQRRVWHHPRARPRRLLLLRLPLHPQWWGYRRHRRRDLCASTSLNAGWHLSSRKSRGQCTKRQK